METYSVCFSKHDFHKYIYIINTLNIYTLISEIKKILNELSFELTEEQSKELIRSKCVMLSDKIHNIIIKKPDRIINTEPEFTTQVCLSVPVSHYIKDEIPNEDVIKALKKRIEEIENDKHEFYHSISYQQ